MKDIKIVIGANFGDEGKGLMTDYFCAAAPSQALVVLSNGGAQRAHTVVTPEGYRHVFRHIGSGSFVDADTWMCKHFIVNPVIFIQEYRKLAKHGIINFNIYMDPRCKLTTIFDMLINQVIEINRGTNKHGSCGIGVYETVYRNQTDLDFMNSFRYNPDTNKFNLDSKNPNFEKYEDYLMTENRFINLKRVNKENADILLEEQKKWAINRYNYYKMLEGDSK